MNKKHLSRIYYMGAGAGSLMASLCIALSIAAHNYFNVFSDNLWVLYPILYFIIGLLMVVYFRITLKKNSKSKRLKGGK